MKNFLLYTFVAALIASPWPIGGNYPFSRTVLLVVSAILLLGWAVVLCGSKSKDALRKYDSNPSGFQLPIVSWVLLLGVAFTFFQSSSISEPFQNRRESAQPSNVASQEADNYSSLNPAEETISVYPPATRKRLVDLLLAVGFFFAAAGLLNDKQSITWVLIAISAVGVCLSGFGIVQKLSFEGRIYGVYELLFGGDPFGPFVNGNNAAGFLLLSFSAILFFVAKQLFTWGRQKSRSKQSQGLLTSPEWGDEDGQGKSIFVKLIEVVSIVEPKHLYFLTLVALIVAGICMTFSRSGMVAMLAVALVVFSLIARTNLKLSLAFAAFMLVAGVSLVAYIDGEAKVSSEIESLSDVDAANVKFLHWGDAIPFAIKNLPWGVGNGTYRYVSPFFQTFTYPRVFAHGESLYVETFVEMGVVGLILLTLVGLMLAYSSIVLIRRDDFFDRSLGIVGLGALIGQASISILDFGIYLPPNSIVMATMMGIVAGRAAQIARPKRSGGAKSNPSPPESEASISAPRRFLGKALLVSLAVVLSLCTIWAIYASYGIESAKLATRKIAYFDRMNKRRDATELASLDVSKIEALLDTARAINPDDADVLIQLGELKVSQVRSEMYRDTQAAVDQQIKDLSAMIEKTRGDGGDPDLLKQNEAILEGLKSVKSNNIWSTSAPVALHQMLRQAGRKSSQSISDVFGDQNIVKLLADAYDDYLQAEEMRPMLKQPPLRLAQLAVFKHYADDEPKTAGLEQEQHYVDVALRRSFKDTQLLYSCGFLALNSGDQAGAVELWSKCLRYPHYNVHERAIVSLCIQEMPMNLFFEQILPQNPQDLIRIATKYFQSPELTVPKRILLTHAKRRINSTDGLSTLDENLMLAEVAVLENNYPDAVKFYQAALKSEPKSVTWRLKYARALFEVEDFDEAMRQLKICQLDSNIRQNQVNALIAKIRRAR